MVTGFDLFHAGSKISRFGQLIGVPINYEYEHVNEIPMSQVIVRGEVPNWNPELKEQFKESLILTEDEQIFGMMRELLMSRTYKFAIDCVLPVVITIAGYAMGHTINNRLQLFSRPRSLRLVLYSIIGVFMYGNYSFITDFTNVHYEENVDAECAKLGERWIKAGVSFYDKMLKKNIATRTLTGDFSLYSPAGNVNYFLRHRSMPLTTRKTFFEKKLEELSSTAVPNVS